MHTNGLFNIMNTLQVIGVTGMAGVAQLVELWIVIPMLPSDISDLTPKTMWTNVDIPKKCGQNADTGFTTQCPPHHPDIPK